MIDTRRPGGIPLALVPVLGIGGWLDVGLFRWVVVSLAGARSVILGAGCARGGPARASRQMVVCKLSAGLARLSSEGR